MNMNINDWINVIVSVISGLAVCIPLAIQLVKFIKKAIQEKNWANVMRLVLKLMEEAEQNFKTGAEKKEYVLDSIKALESTLNYDIDIDAISIMIDTICNTAKKINTK